VNFLGTSTAGNATITNKGADFASSQARAQLSFSESSTAGNAVINTEGATVAGAEGGLTQFLGNATSGSATFNTYGQTAGGNELSRGKVVFSNSSAATNGSEFNAFGSNQTDGSHGGLVQFNDTSTANTTFTIHGGTATGARGGEVQFNGDSSALTSAQFNVWASTDGGLGGSLNFYGNSTANGLITADGDLNGGGGTVLFDENAGAGDSSFMVDGDGATVVFLGSSNAGTSRFELQRGYFSGGAVEFRGNSTASFSTFDLLNGFSAFMGNGRLRFDDSATAGNAQIFSNGGGGFNSNGAEVVFAGDSTASDAFIINSGARSIEALGAILTFANNSTAGDATIKNRTTGAEDGAGGSIRFTGTSSAGTALIENNVLQIGATPYVGAGAQVIFSNESSAASADFINFGGHVTGALGGRIEFSQESTAGSANFDNRGGSDTGLAGGVIQIFGNATAGSGNFINRGGVGVGTDGGLIEFSGNGVGTASAGDSTITNKTGILGGLGGRTKFLGDSTAGSSTLIAEADIRGNPSGGRIDFESNSTGGTARVELNGGALYIDSHLDSGVTIGSLYGNGAVYAGLKILTVDFGTFSGVIYNDGEMGSEVPPTLVKTGQGILTLSGENEYARGTRIEGGILVADNNEALGTGDVTIFGGTLRINQGINITNGIILQGGELERVVGQSQSLASALPTTMSQEGPRQTTAQILAGTASSAAALKSGFLFSSAAGNDGLRQSDIFSFSGVPIIDILTGETDTFVLQLDIGGSIGIDGYLAWFDPAKQEWVNAVDGNIGGIKAFKGNAAYNPLTDFSLGNYGVDTANGTVWAVLNHNSEFSTIPEPTSLALLAGGIAFLTFLRRRRKE